MDRLSREEKKRLRELKRVDREVRSHERAHLAAAGNYAQGGIQFEYAQGPNGQRYAVGGSVNLDTSKASSPEETVKKMKQVRAAALAPPEPSPEDQRVAQKASRNLQEARLKQAKEQGEGKGNGKESSRPTEGEVGAANGSGDRKADQGPGTPATDSGAESGIPGPHRKIDRFFSPRTGDSQGPGPAASAASDNRMNLLV